MRPLNRVAPLLTPDRMRTFQISAPVGTHFRPASCAEAECAAYANGWRTAVDEGTEQGRSQAAYVRAASGRRFTEDRNDAGLTVFTFEAGQRCFRSADHRVSLERDANYLVHDGDWRGKTLLRRHTSAEAWRDDFQSHQAKLTDQ